MFARPHTSTLPSAHNLHEDHDDSKSISSEYTLDLDALDSFGGGLTAMGFSPLERVGHSRSADDELDLDSGTRVPLPGLLHLSGADGGVGGTGGFWNDQDEEGGFTYDSSSEEEDSPVSRPLRLRRYATRYEDDEDEEEEEWDEQTEVPFTRNQSWEHVFNFTHSAAARDAAFAGYEYAYEYALDEASVDVDAQHGDEGVSPLFIRSRLDVSFPTFFL